MRIAYFAHLGGGSESGVLSKVQAQLDHWRAAGHDARAFVPTGADPEPFARRLGDAVVQRYGGPVSRLAVMTGLVRAIRAFRPDVVYLRQDVFYPPMAFLPGRRLVVEVNSDDLVEYRMGSARRAAWNARTRHLVLGRAAAFVFVAGQLNRSPSFARFRGRRVVIPNGIDLSSYPVLPPSPNGRPGLVFVGTAGHPWHGIDKFATLASLRPDWRFDVVGIREPASAAPPNVVWHGPLDRGGTLGVLGSADVGVGALALYRYSLDEASPLKVREYLAVGLPVMYGYSDPDADRLEPYVLRLPNTESNVVDQIGRIDEFVTRSRGVRVPRERIGHIDVASKEAERLALFEEVARA